MNSRRGDLVRKPGLAVTALRYGGSLPKQAFGLTNKETASSAQTNFREGHAEMGKSRITGPQARPEKKRAELRQRGLPMII
jgi:hypothetical protein